jgi:NAD(P)-dependent dehydrogenase (short-subunit alcohol dehydrogenase family)
MELARRVAVVTGGGSGIGRAMCEAFAREGATVVVADIDEAAAAAVVQSVRARGGEALGVRTDVSELASVQALADTTCKTFGKVHVLCNNAGVALWGGLESATHVYNTSKYAVVGLSETLAKDLRPHGLGVSVLCPMGVATQIRASARNRPARLANPAPSSEEPVELMGRTLDAAAVADMVVDAIRTNRLYVITPEEGLEALRRRHERLEQALLQPKA